MKRENNGIAVCQSFCIMRLFHLILEQSRGLPLMTRSLTLVTLYKCLLFSVLELAMCVGMLP